jgi:streptogramin lyase
MPAAEESEPTLTVILTQQAGKASADDVCGEESTIREYVVPTGSHPHDVAPAPDGTVWYTAQASGELGRLDPLSGETHHIALGTGSSPHGVIVGPDEAAWVTDSGLNAIVRVDAKRKRCRSSLFIRQQNCQPEYGCIR